MELLERFAAGDVEAFEALFRPHQCEVYGWILRIVRDPATAEDLTIETFWRMYRAHARFDAPKVPAAERSELQRTILSAMNSLSPRLRVAVVLALVEEESYDRIAEALGISVSAVKVRVFRGVRILRKELSRAGV